MFDYGEKYCHRSVLYASYLQAQTIATKIVVLTIVQRMLQHFLVSTAEKRDCQVIKKQTILDVQVGKRIC